MLKEVTLGIYLKKKKESRNLRMGDGIYFYYFQKPEFQGQNRSGEETQATIFRKLGSRQMRGMQKWDNQYFKPGFRTPQKQPKQILKAQKLEASYS